MAAQLLAESREEIDRADSKANLVLATAGVAYGAIIAGLIAGQVSLFGGSALVSVLAVVAALLGATGFVVAGMAVYPSIGSPEAGKARYFAEVAQYSDVDDLVGAMADKTEDPSQRSLQQVLAVSRIVVRKYRFTQAAIWLFAGSLVMASFAALASLSP